MELTNRVRWMAPVGVAAVVAAAFAGPSLFASASSDLDPLTPEQLLIKVADAEPVPMSGTVVYTARLGLPDIPMPEMRSAAPVNLLSGSSTVRMWTDGEEKSRASLQGPLSEYSIVANGPEVWTYSSSDNEAVHYTVSPEDLAEFKAMDPAEKAAADGTELPTPEVAVRQLLTMAKTSTDVSVGSATTVAGRDAYQLGLVPNTSGSLIDRVLIAVDAKTFTPLRAQVWSTDDSKAPAMEVAFTDVSFKAPDDSVFTFTAPKGATTKDVEVALPDESEATEHPTGMPEGVQIHGTGWQTVVEVDDVDVAGMIAGDPEATDAKDHPMFGSESSQELFKEFQSSKESAGGESPFDAASIYDAVTTKVDGGRMIESALLSVYIGDDGTLLAGAVPADTLLALAHK